MRCCLQRFAKGNTRLEHVPAGVDVGHMLNALTALGVPVEYIPEEQQCFIRGQERAFTHAEPVSLFLGNAGTAMRPLCAGLCLGSGEYTLTGEPRMEERPIEHLVDALRQAGAEVHYVKHEGYPPVHINARGLWGGTVKCDGRLSSQFVSSLLLALPMAAGDTCIEMLGDATSKPYIDLTLQVMRDFGVMVEHDAYQTFYVKGNQVYQAPQVYTIEPDISSASYFMAAAAIKGKIHLKGITRKSMQGELAFC